MGRAAIDSPSGVPFDRCGRSALPAALLLVFGRLAQRA
jgi:hypothetical protein